MSVRMLIAFAVSLVLSSIAVAGPRKPRVVYIHTETATPANAIDVVGKLAGSGRFSAVDLYNANLVTPTLYKRSLAEASKNYERVISEKTSQEMRYLMRLNALEGSGTRMNKLAAGYRAGGKTGTAEKVVNGRYASGANFNVFSSVFPLDNPRYAMVILVDEPHAENEQSGTTAGWNAGEATGRIVQRVAPMLGISPDFSEMLDQGLVPIELR